MTAPDPKAHISSELARIEREYDVEIIFAVESGSRAWGFPSPDSDYDVRFVYRHTLTWYLALEKRRDVIELPIVGDFDINGWDLKKALKLLIKPNPVLLEWLRSPIVYRADDTMISKLADIGQQANHLRPSIYHYSHQAVTQYRRNINGKNDVSLKKYFYCLRPAMALRWLSLFPTKPVPMSLPELMRAINLPDNITEHVKQLLDKKKTTKELGTGSPIRALDEFVETEIERARGAVREIDNTTPELLDRANALFRSAIGAEKP